VWASPEWLTSDREKAAIAGPCDGRVPPSAALNDFLISGSGAGPRYWSASQLNDLASCGFKFFAHRILELTDQAAADNELDPLERGTFTHEILQDFFTRVADFNDRERVFATLREVLERWRVISRGRTRDPIFFELEWSTIEASLWEVVEYELVRYGEKDSRPDSFFQEYPLDFQLNGRLSETPVRIPIRGSIDRLELFRNAIGQIERMRVIDYKTSRGIDRYNQLLRPCNFATTDMQSGIYALGAITRWDDQLAPSPKIEASYVALRHRDKETSALVIPPERLLEGPSADGAYSISKRIFELIEQARSGHFEMDPLECSDFCPYRSVCRFEKSKS
jgi:ATP-dependent helicase/nuclease subunit B